MLLLKLILAFCLIGVISFVLFYLLLKHQDKESIENVIKKDKAGLKKMKEKLKSDQFSWQNLVMSKWVAFGGGFYGVMAVMTYLVVEAKEVIEFLSSEESVLATLAEIGVGDLINFLINSLMNFITAITWPVYWIKKVEGHSIWIWFMVVYAAYLLGQYLAKLNINPDANQE